MQNNATLSIIIDRQVVRMIIREKYLEQIRPFYDKDIIKVITGFRRSGKSVLLHQIKDEVTNDDDHVLMKVKDMIVEQEIEKRRQQSEARRLNRS
jgi:predicted AAA+ superfamily ATPase